MNIEWSIWEIKIRWRRITVLNAIEISARPFTSGPYSIPQISFTYHSIQILL